MPNLSVHLVPFIEIVAGLVAATMMAVYTWRGVRRRRRMRAAQRADDARPRA